MYANCVGTSGPDLSSMTSESLGSIYKEMVSQVAIQMVAANTSAATANHGCDPNPKPASMPFATRLLIAILLHNIASTLHGYGFASSTVVPSMSPR